MRIFIKKCNKDAAGVKCIFIATPAGGKGSGGGSSSHVTLTIRGFLLTHIRRLFSLLCFCFCAIVHVALHTYQLNIVDLSEGGAGHWTGVD